MLVTKSEIMDEAAVKRALVRVSHEIIEKNRDPKELCLIGIKRRGGPIARILAENMRKFDNIEVPVGYVDITMFRDDLPEKPEKPTNGGTEIPFDINGKTVVLVDDVIYTGRTVRAAIEAILKFGRPANIQLAGLVDRGHRELPIRPDYIGKNIPTSRDEIVCVQMEEYDGCTGVRICMEK